MATNNLSVSFKLPMTAIDATRRMIAAQWAQYQAQVKQWSSLTDTQRQEANRNGMDCEMLARFFDVSLPKDEGPVG